MVVIGQKKSQVRTHQRESAGLEYSPQKFFSSVNQGLGLHVLSLFHFWKRTLCMYVKILWMCKECMHTKRYHFQHLLWSRWGLFGFLGLLACWVCCSSNPMWKELASEVCLSSAGVTEIFTTSFQITSCMNYQRKHSTYSFYSTNNHSVSNLNNGWAFSCFYRVYINWNRTKLLHISTIWPHTLCLKHSETYTMNLPPLDCFLCSQSVNSPVLLCNEPSPHCPFLLSWLTACTMPPLTGSTIRLECSNANHKFTAKQSPKQIIVLHASGQNSAGAWLFPTFYGKKGLMESSKKQIIKQIII